MKKLSEETIRAVSEQLKLSFEDQDWGIVNANAGRVKEFILFFYKNSELPKTAQYELLELIIASFNEALLTNTASESKKLFYEFIKEHSHEQYFKPIFDYWKRIHNEKEFPVGRILDAIVNKKNNC